MSIRPASEFNALSLLTQDMQLRLMVLALSGGSAVSNAFTDMADREGLTPRGRARRERERDRVYVELVRASQERMAEFQQRLDRLEQASMEALHATEESLRDAREELRRIRERAYEITLPDGSITKVYRDGDRVRTEAGAEVGRDVVHADDLPAHAPTWSERQHAGDRVESLERERERIRSYQRDLHHARERSESGELSADELDALERRIDETMPESVRRKYEAAHPGVEALVPTSGLDAEGQDVGTLGRPFARATAVPLPDTNDQDPEITRRHQGVSLPAPK